MKKLKEKFIYGNKGITLIALVVTIVILLILAGVSINLVLGPNGLITKAKEAAQKTNEAIAEEEELLNSIANEIDKWVGGTVSVGQIVSVNSTINGENPNYNNPVIPQGYKAVNTDNAKWDVEGGPQYNNGLVIQDESGNEWVWVPVKDPDRMFTNGQVTLAGTSVTTQYYSKLRVTNGQSYSATTPGSTSGIREPSLVTDYDNNSSYYKIISSTYTSGQDMAKDFVKDYEEMHDSIYKYQGFYIGRYELTGTIDNPTLKSGKVLLGKGWYNSYKACRNLKPDENNSVVTTMIWGTQWDETMNWLKETVFKGNESAIDSDSSSWGLYSASSPKSTGSSTTYMKNNIYDLAGNCYEWTQEADNTSHRVVRGGSFSGYGSSFPASLRATETFRTGRHQQ